MVGFKNSTFFLKPLIDVKHSEQCQHLREKVVRKISDYNLSWQAGSQTRLLPRVLGGFYLTPEAGGLNTELLLISWFSRVKPMPLPVAPESAAHPWVRHVCGLFSQQLLRHTVCVRVCVWHNLLAAAALWTYSLDQLIIQNLHKMGKASGDLEFEAAIYFKWWNQMGKVALINLHFHSPFKRQLACNNAMKCDGKVVALSYNW